MDVISLRVSFLFLLSLTHSLSPLSYSPHPLKPFLPLIEVVTVLNNVTIETIYFISFQV